jgi:hypothetical protein
MLAVPHSRRAAPEGTVQPSVEGAVLVAVLARDVEHVTRKYRLLK